MPGLILTDADAEVGERQGHLGRRSTGPLQAGDGIASGVAIEQEFDRSDDVGGFSSIGLFHTTSSASAPRRVRPGATFRSSSCSEEAALLFVQQAVEQQNGGLEFTGETRRAEGLATRGTALAVCRVRI